MKCFKKKSLQKPLKGPAWGYYYCMSRVGGGAGSTNRRVVGVYTGEDLLSGGLPGLNQSQVPYGFDHTSPKVHTGKARPWSSIEKEKSLQMK